MIMAMMMIIIMMTFWCWAPFWEWWTQRCSRSSWWSSPPDSPATSGPEHHVHYYDDDHDDHHDHDHDDPDDHDNDEIPERACSNLWRFAERRHPPSKFDLNYFLSSKNAKLYYSLYSEPFEPCWCGLLNRFEQVSLSWSKNICSHTHLFKLGIKLTTVKDQLCNFRNINILK